MLVKENMGMQIFRKRFIFVLLSLFAFLLQTGDAVAQTKVFQLGKPFTNADGTEILPFISLKDGWGYRPEANSKVYFEYQLFKLDGSLLDEGVSSSKMVELDPGVRFLLEGMKEGAHLTGTLQLYRDRSVGKVKVKEFVKLDLHLIALSDPSIYRRSDQPGLSETELRKEAISDRELVSLGGDCREYMVTRGYGEASSDYPDYEKKCGIHRSLSEAAEFGPVRYVKIDVPTGLDKAAFYGCKKYVLDLWYHPSWHEIGTYCMHREGQQVTTFNSFRRNPDGGYYSKFCGLKFLYCENRRTENETYFNYMLAE